MSNKTEPAFPFTGAGAEGLTKREYFAAMAMQGLLTCATDTDATIPQMAEDAVSASNALLAELEKGES